MGGGEIARYIGSYGEDRLHSVVFAGAIPPYLLKTDDNPDGGLGEEDVKGMEDGAREDREGFLDPFTTNFFSADGELKVSEEQRQDALKLQAPARDEAVVGCIGAFSRTDFRNDLERITVPTLVIHGDSDAIVPFEVSGKRTAETIAGSKLVVVEGAPHGFNVSHADEFNRALLDFLADAGPEPEFSRRRSASAVPGPQPALRAPDGRMSALAGLVDKGLVAPDWAEALAPVDEQITAMGQFLRAEIAAGRGYLPAGEHVLRAFSRPLASVKVLIVGQDPYPTPGHPVGLSFSVAPGVAPPKSLVNIFRELVDDLGVPRPTSGDLTPWADAGVMLLNRSLTVTPGPVGLAPRARLGGRSPTRRSARLALRAKEGAPLTAILWGRDAQSLKPELTPIPWVESVHPSPLSAHRGFFGSRPFSRVNRMLAEQGGTPVDWRLP